MENIQINGQKIWGPPKDWAGPPPPHGTEIFIKNIPDDIFEDELYDLFSSFGKIYEVRLPVHWTGINKGYAFVRYTTISEADSAIYKLNNYFIRPNRQIKVERSLDNTRLFLSSVPNEKTAEELKSDLLTVVENVKTVYVYPALKNQEIYRGYAFVEFMCHRDAAIAKRILTPDMLFNLFERKCIAAWAKPLPYLSEETLKQTNVLFMRNVPNNAKNIAIKIAVNSLIAPDNVEKVKKQNSFAFLTFSNHDMAERAMNKIMYNPFLLGTKAVHVEWAIPRELGKSFSVKDLYFKEEDEAKLKFDSDMENYQRPLLKIQDDYKSKSQAKFMIENKTNYNNPQTENLENFLLPNHSNRKLLLNQISKFEPFSDLNKNKIITSKTDLKPNCLRQSNTNKPNQFSPFVPDQNYNPQKQRLMTEFGYSNLENWHLANWLQSLALTDQPSFCASSPTWTSPSTDSSTNLSQLSYGSGNSMECNAKVGKIKANAENGEGFPWF